MFHARKVIPFKISVLWSIAPPWKMKFDDVVDTPSSALLEEEDRQKTGKDRLRSMFTFNEFGELSPELNSSIHAGLFGLFFGSLYGGVIRSREAYLQFFEQNQATAFKHHMEAKKLLQDHVTVSFAKGALAWGWRLSLFTGSLILVSTAISVYRGKSGIIEYIAAGGVSGCLFRSNLGLRGMIVGGLLGTALGTIGGCLIFATLKVSGLTMDDIRGTQYQFRRMRTEAHARSIKQALEGESYEGELLKEHDSHVNEVSSLHSLPESH